jgi:hypothetical protein
MLRNQRIAIAVIVLGFAPCAVASVFGDEEETTPVPAAANPATLFDKLANAKGWRERDAAASELGSLGDRALNTIVRGASNNEDAEVRKACYELLSKQFINHRWAGETMATTGLLDSDQEIRYICAFDLGTKKIYAAHRRLRTLMNDKSASDRARLAAAKSLAELGEPDVMPRLYRALSSDHYMDRYMANIGIKALSGKDLNDFNGYEYGEGAFVSGGVETLHDEAPEDTAEKLAKRYMAIASFCKWLREQHPELYKHLEWGFF